MNKNAMKLLEILQYHAPNGKAQEKCSEIYRQASLEGANVELQLATTLFDGLAFGNWPWSDKV